MKAPTSGSRAATRHSRHGSAAAGQETVRAARPRRSQEAYNRFGSAVNGPMTLLALVMIPWLLVPMIARPSPPWALLLRVADY